MNKSLRSSNKQSPDKVKLPDIRRVGNKTHSGGMGGAFGVKQPVRAYNNVGNIRHSDEMQSLDDSKKESMAMHTTFSDQNNEGGQIQSSNEPKETAGDQSSRRTEARRFSQSIHSTKDIQNLNCSKNSKKGVSKRATEQCLIDAEQKIVSNT